MFRRYHQSPVHEAKSFTWGSFSLSYLLIEKCNALPGLGHCLWEKTSRETCETWVRDPALQGCLWSMVVARKMVPGLGCGPFQCQALSVSACCCSRGFHPPHSHGHSLLQSPQAHQRLIFHAGGPAGEVRSQGQVGGRESWRGRCASIWAWGGCWVWASNWTENSTAWHTGLEVHVALTTLTPCSNKNTSKLFDFNGIYSLMLWHSCINKTLKNVHKCHFMNQFNNMLFRHLQWT